MKREHNFLTTWKRGSPTATEKYLLSAMVLNLKRMVKDILSAMLMDKMWAENMIFQSIFCGSVNSSNFLHYSYHLPLSEVSIFWHNNAPPMINSILVHC